MVITKRRPAAKEREVNARFSGDTFEGLAKDLKEGRIPLDRVSLSDDRVKGLRVIIRNTGLISYHVQYDVEDKEGHKSRPYLKVGDYPAMSIPEARKLATTIHELAGMGIDPQAGLHDRLVRELKEKGSKWRP